MKERSNCLAEGNRVLVNSGFNMKSESFVCCHALSLRYYYNI